MKSESLLAVAAAAAVAVPAHSDIVGYVDNPTGNSTDWTTAVLGMGGVINSDMDFETHSIGPLDSNHYSSLGVTLSVTGGFKGIEFGQGPGQANTSSGPTSNGEGLHPASNFLFANAVPGTFTISFDFPVIGVGLFTIDLFNPGSQPNLRNAVSIEAFDGPNGTGTSLGVFDSAQFNFQSNFLYFMGVTSSDNNIRSLVFDNPGDAGDQIGIDDLFFAEGITVLADLDIKPGSCPNSFNRKSNGVLPVALVGDLGFDVEQVDLTSVRLERADGIGGSVQPNEGPPGPHSVFEDVATGFSGVPCDCHELAGDGIDDLSMKFKSQEVVAALELNDLPPGAPVELCVGGELLDGTEFEACDCIRIVPAPDIDGDGAVSAADLLMLLGAWGPCTAAQECLADLDDNRSVGISDLLTLLANWG